MRVHSAVLAAGLVAIAFPGVGGDAPLFEGRVIELARAIALDLYEPSISVSDTGTVYAAAHSVYVFTTRAPAWFSQDDGRTWLNLPGLVPGTYAIPGGGMGDGDEGVVVTGENGRAWMLDNGRTLMHLNAWCADGLVQCGYNPVSWTPVGAKLSGCGENVTVDRPWSAYGGGKLVLVNNARLTAQIGLVDAATGLGSWNFCAGVGGIPGVPALRASDGLFAVPQLQNVTIEEEMAAEGLIGDPVPAPPRGKRLVLLLGTDVGEIRTTEVLFDVDSLSLACGGNGVNWGWTAFSKSGTLYAVSATSLDSIGIAASRDGGTTFAKTSLEVPGTAAFVWLSGSLAGEGALLTYAVPSPDCGRLSYHVAHVGIDEAGSPIVRRSFLAVANGGNACGHYAGSAVGPDGRAYLIAFSGPCYRLPGAIGTTPLTVYVQTEGPTL